MSNTTRSRCLVVEDDRTLLKLITEILEASAFNIKTLEAKDAETAIAICKGSEKVIVVILTDLTLPDASGLDIARLLKPYAPNIPIIIITGRPDEGERARAIAYEGVFEYISKPFNNIELLQIVGDAISRYEFMQNLVKPLVVIELEPIARPKLNKKQRVALWGLGGTLIATAFWKVLGWIVNLWEARSK